MVSDLYGTSVSVATILNASARSYTNLAPFEDSLVSALVDSKVVHADESGLRVVKKTRSTLSMNNSNFFNHQHYSVFLVVDPELFDHCTAFGGPC